MEQGFTLVEALLVITIGTILLGSATVLYNQYHRMEGDSIAYDRVVALQSCVESLYSMQNGVYPSLTALQSYWSWKRPLDASMSPWGGYAISGSNDGMIIQGGTSSTTVVPNPTSGDRGMLYYWTASSPNSYVSAVDQSGGSQTPVNFLNYLVAIVPDTYSGPPPYYFVRGGRLAPWLSGSQTVTGHVGGGTAPNTPW